MPTDVDDDVLVINTGGSDYNVLTDFVTPAGHAAPGHAQLIKLIDGTADGISPLVIDVNGADVDVTRLPSLPAGGNVIGGVTISGTPAVTIPTPVPVTDNAGSLTVDAPVGTPAFVRLSDGASPIATLPVSLASVPSHNVTNAGTFAVQADTELPAAAALADGAANPTTPTVGAALLGFNGTTFDRLRSRGLTNSKPLDVAIVDNNGNQITSFGGSGGTSMTDDGAFTVASSLVTPVGYLADETSTDLVDEGDVGLARMTWDRQQRVAAASAPTATLTNVAASASSVTVLAANVNRKGVIIFNDSAASLYLKFGATASLTSFTYKINPFDHLELPSGPVITTTILDGIWSSATGNARVTELT